MKKYEKTQSKLNKILVGLILLFFLYNAISLEFVDLSWDTNKVTYRNIFICLGILIGFYLDYKDWFRKQEEK